MTQPTFVADDQVRSMLEAFAGPPIPELSHDARRRRHATRRTLLVVAVAIAALAVAVPVGLALLSGLWETPKQFLNDRNQPAQAKQAIQRLERLESKHGIHLPRLQAVERLLTAPTPSGDVSVFLLRFIGNRIGYFYTGPMPPGVSGTISLNSAYSLTALTPPCRRGWALQYIEGGGGDSLPRYRSDGYVFGRAAARVASIHVRYPDGSTTPGTVSNGFFFSSLRSSAANSNVAVLADDQAGQPVGRLVIGGYGGSPFPTSKPWPDFLCVG